TQWGPGVGASLTFRSNQTVFRLTGQQLVADGGGLLPAVTNSFGGAEVRRRMAGTWDAVLTVSSGRSVALQGPTGKGKVDTQAALDSLDGRQRLGGIPLGRLQVFAPIRMGNVPDCPSRQGPLGCVQRESPLEEGSGKIRGTVRPETVSALRYPPCRPQQPAGIANSGPYSVRWRRRATVQESASERASG